MRAGIVVAVVTITALLTLGACGTVLDIDEEASGGPTGTTDGSAFDGPDTLPDGAPRRDGGAGEGGGGSCAYDCSPGACGADDKCEPFTAVSGIGRKIVGVAATDDRIFYASPAPAPGSGGQIGVAVGGALPVVLHADEHTLGAIRITGPNEIRWGRGAPGSDGGYGVFRSAFDGSGRMRASETSLGTCTSIAYVAPSMHFCSEGLSPGAVIKREQGPVQAIWVNTSSAVRSIDAVGTTVYWADVTSLRRENGALDLPTSGGILVLDNLSPVAIAAAGTRLYFTETDGKIRRVNVDGSGAETLHTPRVPTSTVAGITVTPNGKYTYWADDDKIMGLALPP